MQHSRFFPLICFILTGLVLIGTACTVSAVNMMAEQPNRDVWQHAAALRALADNIFSPSNPFVVSDETSRHFQPALALGALLVIGLNVSIWQSLAILIYINGAILMIGTYFFSVTYFRSPWSPTVFLFILLFAWGLPIAHTGLHSYETLLFGSGYPATLLIGLSLILWATMFRALDQPVFCFGLVALTALMLSIHQLGAVIGFSTAGLILLLRPQATLRNRATATLSLCLGVLLSTAWPYFNPLDLMRAPGNSTWDFNDTLYQPIILLLICAPTIIGLFGLIQRNDRIILISFIFYCAGFSLLLLDFYIASRLLGPVMLMLHIGLSSLVLAFFEHPWSRQVRGPPLLVITPILIGITLFIHLDDVREGRESPALLTTSPYQAAQILASDIPDTQVIAAYDVTVWPLVATGQRALSIPWPEPGIRDLADRQQANRALFDPNLSREERAMLADQSGVRSLYVYEWLVPAEVIETLRAQSASVTVEGGLLRFDL